MTSSRPYLIRALYEWIVDNGFTPYMLVDTALEVVHVPRAFVENGRIILNISPEATHSLVLGNEAVIHVPVVSVLAIYARENGQGMMFGEHDDMPPDPGGGTTKAEVDKVPSAPPEVKRPNLKIVK